jgi:hypothetical protein
MRAACVRRGAAAAAPTFACTHAFHTCTTTQEKQAQRANERAAAREPKPLTETQLAWKRLAEEKQAAAAAAAAAGTATAAARVADAPTPAPAAAARAQHTRVITSTPFYTVTWKVRLTSLGTLPMPWVTQQQQ